MVEPVARTYLIETFGCQMNSHDSERIAGLLEQAGYARATDPSTADVLVLNTCSIRERAEDKLFSRLGEARTGRKNSSQLVAVTGCVAQQEGARLFERAQNIDIVVGTQAMRSLPALLQQAIAKGNPQVDVNPYDDVSFPLGLAVRNHPVKAYINIVEGCNDFCAFCVVPYTRGHERMRPAAEIIEEVENAVATGRCEVHLLGQIVNHYKAPDVPDCDFSGLLERVQGVAGVERIRFSSPHPRHVTSRMINAIRDLPSVCQHLHLPVQSGSTSVLRAMRRRHSRSEYLELVGKIRATIPSIALSTDIIVGFPGETDADFEETLSLVQRTRYHSMFSFKYSERPSTLASLRMPETVPEEEKTRRITTLQLLQRDIQLQLNERMVGRVVSVLADDISRRSSEELSGRTSGNTVVNFPGDRSWLGRFINVKISKAGPHSLWGEPDQLSVGRMDLCKSK
ncbi:MAG: tRNA (N6-isopentenyl adenosine(37)-C2)-methylthiotransferase MiaB [Acidobacteriota bacterium]|nr:tRNA (N6-isopentenyl adenosine(37)-C2)-methylthiotransferase MiaB [Acidobacteriota bacterium]